MVAGELDRRSSLLCNLCPIDGDRLITNGDYGSDDGRESRWLECPSDHTWPLHMTDRDVWDPDLELVEERLADYQMVRES